MALRHRDVFINQSTTSSRLLHCPTHFPEFPKISFLHPNSVHHIANCRILAPQTCPLAVANVKASFREPYGESHKGIDGNGNTDFDAFLSTIEVFSLLSSAAVAVFVAVRCGMQKRGALGRLGSGILMWQCVVVVGGLVAGTVIRRRQWRRVCGVGFSRGPDLSGPNLLERVEKLEEDLRSSTKIVRSLLRQLEKLGIRFRVSRRALKDPIAETATLVQKNSEVNRVLAAKEDNHEKELGEIQEVLFAMQEQQEKQLELILAIGKAGKFLQTENVESQDDEKTSYSSNLSIDGGADMEINQAESPALHKETSNDKP